MTDKQAFKRAIHAITAAQQEITILRMQPNLSGDAGGAVIYNELAAIRSHLMDWRRLNDRLHRETL